jgi:hypothetical protein
MEVTTEFIGSAYAAGACTHPSGVADAPVTPLKAGPVARPVRVTRALAALVRHLAIAGRIDRIAIPSPTRVEPQSHFLHACRQIRP